jgi:hypothetical protein
VLLLLRKMGGIDDMAIELVAVVILFFCRVGLLKGSSGPGLMGGGGGGMLMSDNHDMSFYRR